MAQFARPVADAVVGSWEDEGGATTSLFESIDETTPNDTDFVTSEVAPATSAYAVDLGTIEDPQSSSGHVVRYRYQKDSAAGAQIDLTVELRQGYVSEGTQGTLIASNSHTNIGNGWTDGSFTLSAGEADSITDYSDLQLRFVANQV